MPYVQLRQGQIHFVQFGPDRSVRHAPILFIHGAGAGHQIWFHQLKSLGQKRRAIALDLPGHGGSNGEGADRIEIYRDAVRSFMGELGLHRVVLVGHSMGGAITQSFALAYPGQLAAIVLVGTGAKLRVHPKIFDGLRDDARTGVELIAGWARSPGAPSEVVEQDAAAMLRTPIPVIEGDFRACDAFDLMHQVREISAATLVICGADDLLTPPKYAEYLRQEIVGSQLAVIDGAGHMVMLERPEEVTRAMERFLEGLGC